MTIEIKRPELESLIQQQLESGSFQDVDELLTEALHALREHSESDAGRRSGKRLVDVLSSLPFAGSELTIERQLDYPRSIEL